MRTHVLDRNEYLLKRQHEENNFHVGRPVPCLIFSFDVRTRAGPGLLPGVPAAQQPRTQIQDK